MADSNVVLPHDYVAQLMRSFRPGTGLVCSPPIGSRPKGFWAEIECAFLNTHQARWQLSADSIGFGFAQGKSMLWRRDVLEHGGGIEALGRDVAEDAAATKMVRAQGLTVRLVDRPFEQPLGFRRARQVWDRQVRWARLRRATFPLYYAPEVLTGALFPTITVALAAAQLEIDVSSAALLFAGLWYGVEALTARAAGWHLSLAQAMAWIARDLLLPILWVQGLTGSKFVWRGNEMTVSEPVTHLATDRPNTV
jgi:ceramide glucosyltransferase